MSVEQIRAEPLAQPNPEPRDIGLTIPQDFFERQEQVFETQLRQYEPDLLDHNVPMEDMFNAHEALFDSLQPEAPFLEEAMFEQPAEVIDAEPMPGPESLEQIVEANDMQPGDMMPDEMRDYDDSMMTPELFEEEMEPMEPYPDPLQHYGGMMPQEMYDEQMPEMMDPYMMPGMIDPYMMPGPFGPGPMLDPGPGGPP